MNTKIIKIDPKNIDVDKLKYAAEVIRCGGLVAFPTETVYGLGANALNSNAVNNIFKAKGRPADNPLIVHISEKSVVCELVSYTPLPFTILADKFWPGSLTLIMPKSGKVPPVVTAHMDTIAVRIPSHPVALSLISKAGVPIAAPSANTSGRPSPTNASHVIEDLFGKVDVIIDSDYSHVGVESTVLDITTQPPIVLRPGGVTLEQLGEVLGDILIDPSNSSKTPENITPKSPGMKYTHYSPKAKVIIVEGEFSRVIDKINQLISEYKLNGRKAGVLATNRTTTLYKCTDVISMGDRDHPESIASGLFGALRELDKRQTDVIFAESIEDSGIGLAVMNRLNKAAGYNIIKVV